MSDGDNIKPLPVKFKAPPSEEQPMLKVVDRWDKDHCDHRMRYHGGHMEEATYLIREGETEVECGLCSAKLDPVFVLLLLARKEAQWNRTRKHYQEEMARLADRTRTKCECCGKMTRISRR